MGQVFEDLVGVIDGRWHQFGRFAARVAEHDALVAGTLFFVGGLLGIDTGCDIDRLGMEQHVDLSVFPVEPVLLVADVLDRHAGGVGDPVLRHRAGAARFASDHHAVRRAQRFARRADVPRVEASLGAFAEKQVHNFIRDPVADLVGMALGNGFRGEQIGFTCHEAPKELKQSCCCWRGCCSVSAGGQGWALTNLHGPNIAARLRCEMRPARVRRRSRVQPASERDRPRSGAPWDR